MSIPRANNFDLVRLLAACQVAVGHAFVMLRPEDAAAVKPMMWWLGCFPGVPIFFTVSGFLIFWSFERNAHDVRGFYRNRVLRIYPGMWFCFAVTIALLFAFQQISLSTLGRADFWGWTARQVTFFQFGTPDILRHWGDGQVNRSLWTISLELQFYALIPFIYYVFTRFGKRWMIGWAVLFFGSIGVWAAQCQLLPKGTLVHDIHELCVTSCLYNFLYGIAFYKCWQRIKSFVEGRFLYWLAAYLAFVGVFGKVLGWYATWPYSPEPVRMGGYFILSGLALSLAFSFCGLSERTIRGFDISYGLYIYHGLVLNVFFVCGWLGRWELAILILPVSCAIAAASWVFVERPMLRKKGKTRQRISAADVSLEEPAVASAGAV